MQDCLGRIVGFFGPFEEVEGGLDGDFGLGPNGPTEEPPDGDGHGFLGFDGVMGAMKGVLPFGKMDNEIMTQWFFRVHRRI